MYFLQRFNYFDRLSEKIDQFANNFTQLARKEWERKANVRILYVIMISEFFLFNLRMKS